jgi:hypothetical protein
MFEDPDAAPARNQPPVNLIATILAITMLAVAIASIAYGQRAGRLAPPAAQATPAIAGTPAGQ